MITRLWSVVWGHYLDSDEYVIQVKSCRTALVGNRYGKRRTITPMPVRTFLEKRKYKNKR